MKHLTLLLLLFLLRCSQQGDNGSNTVFVPKENVLTHILTIGENVQDEYLLARPRDIEVNDIGDIFVVDEDRVKVFDNKGGEKTIIGGPGQGPGEFLNAKSVTYTSNKLLTVGDRNNLSLFGENFDYLNRANVLRNTKFNQYKRLGTNFLVTFNLKKAYSFNKTDRFLNIDGILKPGTAPYLSTAELLFFVNPDTVIQLDYYDPKDIVRIGNSSGGISYRGNISWDVLPDNRVIYTNSETDKEINGDKYEYVLTIFSAETLEQTKIYREFKPLVIKESDKDKTLSSSSGFERSKSVTDFMQEIMDEIEYYPPVRNLKTDANIVFIFTWIRNEEGETLTEIYDDNTQKFIGSAYFKRVPHKIRNGKAYFLNRGGNNTFPNIEIHTIDPSLYPGSK